MSIRKCSVRADTDRVWGTVRTQCSQNCWLGLEYHKIYLSVVNGTDK